MTVTERDARRIIAREYPAGFRFRLTTGCTIGVRSVADTACGLRMLAWRKLTTGDSAVCIGAVDRAGRIDWTWDGT